jgi:hypothetical protein
MSPTALKAEAEAASGLLEEIRSKLNAEERDHFALELLDAARSANQIQLEHMLESWIVTITVREHADAGWQTKEYTNMAAAGELFSGVDGLNEISLGG